MSKQAEDSKGADTAKGKMDAYDYFLNKQKGTDQNDIKTDSELSPDSDDQIEESYASSSKKSTPMGSSKEFQKHYKTDEKKGKSADMGLFSGKNKVPEMEGGGIDDDLFEEQGIEVDKEYSEPMSPEAADDVPLAPSEPSGGVNSEVFTAHSATKPTKAEIAQSATMPSKPTPAPPAKPEDKMAVTSPKKHVKFDAGTDMPSAVHKKKGSSSSKGTFGASIESEIKGYSAASQKVAKILRRLEGEITQFYNSGESDSWSKALIDYCQIANEAAQNLNLQKKEDQKTALKILEKCLEVLNQNSNRLNSFDELFYETHNNIARCYNLQGNIKKSLGSLIQAMQHVDRIAADQEPGSVTIIPELSLNICNAFIYLNQYKNALEYAQKAVTSSDDCIACLTRKLDQPVAQDPANKAEQERLSQLYQSHSKLHIQGYQAKGMAYEKLHHFSYAISEYQTAKAVVEKNFGTGHQLFGEIVEMISAANAKLKTQNYSNKDSKDKRDTKQAVGGKSSLIGGKPQGIMQNSGSSRSLNRTEKSTPSSKSKSKKRISPERDVIQSDGESLDIRSVYTGSSQFERGSMLSLSKSKRTEQKSKSGVTFSNLSSRHRVLKSSQRQPRMSGSKSAKLRPSSAILGLKNSCNECDLSYCIRQPPMNAGGRSHIGFNKMSHVHQNNRSGHHHHQWRHEAPLEHKYVPVQHVGPYPHVQAVRTQHLPKIIGRSPKRPSSSSKRLKIKKGKVLQSSGAPSQPSDFKNTAELDELQKMRQQIKQREMTEIEDRLKAVQQKQADQQKNVMAALDHQRAMILENQQREREIARLEREAMMSQQAQPAAVVEDFGYRQSSCQQQPQMPQYVHPQYGPAVFDYNYMQWTYPYAQWYGPYAQEAPEMPDEQIIEAPAPVQEKFEAPKIEMKEFSAQKDFNFDPKPEVKELMTQTSLRNSTKEFAIQTAPISGVEVGTSPEQVVVKKAVPKPKKVSKYTEDQAALIITRRCKTNILRKREIEYRSTLSQQGVVYSIKRHYSKMAGAMEIMSMFMEHDLQRRCVRVKFTIFNYATKQYTYFGVYEKLKGLDEFDVDILLGLTKLSLDQIEFEKSPFKMHILCMQSIINANLPSKKELQKIKLEHKKEKELKKKPEPKPRIIKEPKEQEIIYVDPKPKQKGIEIQTQTDEDPDYLWQLRQVQQQQLQKPLPAAAPQKGKLTRKQAVIKIQAWTRSIISRKTYYRMYSQRYNQLMYSFFIKKSYSGGSKCFIVELYKHQEFVNGMQAGQYYTLRAKENKKSRSTQKQVVTQYREVRLPDDTAMLCYYMQQATVLKINPKNGKIITLMLQRMRIHNFKDFECKITKTSTGKLTAGSSVGCQQKLQFAMSSYPNHICTVSKRTRWMDSSQKVKVKDWKIEVTQLTGAKSSDYLVVRRLPCPLHELGDLIQNSLGIQYNKRIVPATILHLFWEVRCITIYSQSFYDLNSLRFNTVFHGHYHFSQNIQTSSRIPSQQQISDKEFDPLYEIYIQKLVPKQNSCSAFRYRTDAQQKRKKLLREFLFGMGGKLGSLNGDSSSDSEDENDPYKYKDDQCYWDEEQLEKMQLDEDNIKKTYLKVTCTRTIDKQDQDYFKIEEDICKWAHSDVEYQYLMENLILRQVRNQNTGEININVVGLKIRNSEERFQSDQQWISYLRGINEPEMFITQDVQRWKNQNIACSVLNSKFQGGGYLVEAINVDKPHERTYLRLPSLRGMRSKILMYYIDSCLKFFSAADKASGLTQEEMMNTEQSSGFGADLIEQMAFSCGPDAFKKRMKKHVLFKEWTYEVIDDQEFEAGGDTQHDVQMQKMLAAQAEEERRAEEKRVNQEIKDKREEMARRREEKKSQSKVSQKVEVSSSQVIKGDLGTVVAPQGELVSKFIIKAEITPVKTTDVELTITKFDSPLYFRVDILNIANTTNDDKLTLKAFRLPGNLKASEKDNTKIANVFKQKLRIIWQQANLVEKGQVRRMQDAFIDNSVVREEIIHKIVEVPVYPDGYQKKESKKDKKDKDKKKQKRSKSSDSDTDFDKSKIDEQEYAEIKKDIKEIRSVIKKIKSKTEALKDGVAGWFQRFDTDNSDEIDLKEFIEMILYLGITLEDRIGIMLFRVFDRSDQGFFGQTEFIDIVDKRMIPNYKRIVRSERERFNLYGLNITFPKRKKQEVKVVYRDKIKIKEVEVPKEKIVEKIVEKKIYLDKIVEVEKVVEVEVPTYIDRVVEKPVYIQQAPPPQQYIQHGPPPVQYVHHQGPPPQHIYHGGPPQQQFVPIPQQNQQPPIQQNQVPPQQPAPQHQQAPPAQQQPPPQQVQIQQELKKQPSQIIAPEPSKPKISQDQLSQDTRQEVKSQYEHQKTVTEMKKDITEKTNIAVVQEAYIGESKVVQRQQKEANQQYVQSQLQDNIKENYDENKPMFEKVSDEDPVVKFSFKNKNIIKTSEQLVELNAGRQIHFKPGQILIQADWCDQNYGKKKSKLFIQIWRGAELKCVYEQDIFGAYDRTGKQTKMVYTIKDEIVRIGQSGDWYKIYGYNGDGGPHKLTVKYFECTIIAEFDPNREKNAAMRNQANQMTQMLLQNKKGLVTLENVMIGQEVQLRQDWPEAEYGRFMKQHGPKKLIGKIISYCDANNKNYGKPEDATNWHNREYVVNGRLSETHCVVVKWSNFDSEMQKKLKIDQSDKEFSGLQGSYRIGHQGQFWLQQFDQTDGQGQTKQKLQDISKLDQELVSNAKMIFERVDKDKSGRIDYKEFAQVMRELGYSLSQSELDQLIKVLDVDGSGQIEFQEFVSHIAAGTQARQQQAEYLDWDDDQNQQKELKLQVQDVFVVNNATMTYTIFSGKQKDYYMSTETKHKNQVKTLFMKVLIGDNYEETARQTLKKNNVTNPSPATLAKEIGIMYKSDLMELCKDCVTDADPEEWIPDLKAKIKYRVA